MFAGSVQGQGATEKLALSSTTDCGSTWSDLHVPIPDHYFGNRQYLLVAPSDPRVMYAGTGDCGGGWLFSSVDGGASWSELGGIAAPADLLVNPADPNRLVALIPTDCSDPNVPELSADGGRTWFLLPSSERWWPASDMQAPAADPSVAYGLGGGRLLRSLDGGMQWHPLDIGSSVSAYALAAGDPALIYAATGDGISRSVNGGDGWVRLGPGPGMRDANEVSTLLVDPSDSSVLVALTGRGLFESDDGAESWTPLGGPEPGSAVTGISIGGDPPALYATTRDGLFVDGLG